MIEALTPALSIEADALAASIDVAVVRADPLASSELSVAVLPARIEVSLVSSDTAKAKQPAWKIAQFDLRSAVVDLDDGYSLDIDAGRDRVLLNNSITGHETQIWGDASVDENGAALGRFWGTVSFHLANGTLITADTCQSETNADAYMLDKLTITLGHNALVVRGVTAPEPSPLDLELSRHGIAIDDDTRDGLVLEERHDGSGWLRDDRKTAADATFLETTAAGARWGPESQAMSRLELGRILSRVVFVLIKNLDLVWQASNSLYPDDASIHAREAHSRRATLDAEQVRWAILQRCAGPAPVSAQRSSLA